MKHELNYRIHVLCVLPPLCLSLCNPPSPPKELEPTERAVEILFPLGVSADVAFSSSKTIVGVNHTTMVGMTTLAHIHGLGSNFDPTIKM